MTGMRRDYIRAADHLGAVYRLADSWEISLGQLPDELRALARTVCGVLDWDMLDAEQRRRCAELFDYQNDPAREYALLWAITEIREMLAAGLAEASERDAAALLAVVSAVRDKVEDAVNRAPWHSVAEIRVLRAIRASGRSAAEIEQGWRDVALYQEHERLKVEGHRSPTKTLSERFRVSDRTIRERVANGRELHGSGWAHNPFGLKPDQRRN
jgi:hypothetical protein